MEQQLTITNVLRCTNHDFVNHLHLIKMNLDLGRVAEAIQIINDVSDNYRMLSNINHLKLPKTVEWLQTCFWRFPALQITVKSNVSQPVACDIDEELVTYLEQTIIHIHDCVDPFTEQKLAIAVESNNKWFRLKFDLTGLWDTIKFQAVELKNLNVQTIIETNNSWTYVLSINQE